MIGIWEGGSHAVIADRAALLLCRWRCDTASLQLQPCLRVLVCWPRESDGISDSSGSCISYMSTCHAQVVASSSSKKKTLFFLLPFHHLLSPWQPDIINFCLCAHSSFHYLNLQQVKLLLLGPISGRVVQLFTLGTAIGRKWEQTIIIIVS